MTDIGIQLNCFDKLYFARENETMLWFRKLTGVPNITCDYHGFSEPMAKIVFGDMREEQLMRVKALLEAHPRYSDFDYIRSEKSLYEILPKGASKGTALRKMTELFGIDIAKTIAVGDYNNDISMLETAGAGFAVANAVPEVKAAANYTTVSNNDGAIAAIVDMLDCGKLSL
jgi:hydroxymethylpyrimidine pyrophosphatase-like HAD family hydrolase